MCTGAAACAEKLLLENALRRALERGQLELHYQPQVHIATGEVRCVEALLRWHHPELGRISPAEFIPVAEGSGQIVPIGEWVLRTALAQLRMWRQLGLPHLKMAVNLSAIQFRQPQLPELVTRLLHEADLPPDALELELTEGAAVSDPRSAMDTMQQLRACGVHLSMDDFGTGYSSLNYLSRFRLDTLKIDRSFVHDMLEDPDDLAIVDGIVGLANAFRRQVIAEGVETVEHGSMLTGSLLCSVWFFFSYMLIGNEAACKREVVRFEEWMVRLLGGSDKDKQSV